MRGRPRKPTALKLIEGNPGRRPIAAREPAPVGKVGECPAHLKGTARQHWFRLAAMLSAVATAWDADALAAYCAAYGRWVEAEEHMTANGTVVKSPNGYPIQNPYLAIANKAMEQMDRYGSKFGMTPADRTRVRVPEQQSADDMDERMLG